MDRTKAEALRHAVAGAIETISTPATARRYKAAGPGHDGPNREAGMNSRQ